MSHNFINFHVLISHSPSCLNRDDMNMQKNAVFGGKRRVRVSSQSLKRAMRTGKYYKKHFPEKSIRTRQLRLLADELQKLLNEKGNNIDKYWVEKGIQAFTSSSATTDDSDEVENVEEDEDIEGVSKSAHKKIAVAPWSLSEFEIICQLVKEVFEAPLDDKELSALKKLQEKEQSRKATPKKPKRTNDEIKEDFLFKKVKKIIETNINSLTRACGQATDIALSGRMATSGLMTTIEGALAVAHAITTHEVNDSDIDWFTAVDDLQEQGSGHLDTQEFSSGVFYRYASLNIGQLQENMGGVSRKQALEVAAHVLHMLATVVPSAKQQTFAAHNLADLALVSFSDLPVSLANAFESPVRQKGDGFLKPSLEYLNSYWSKVHKGYGLNENCAEFTLADGLDVPDGITKQDSLEALKTWIRQDGKSHA